MTRILTGGAFYSLAGCTALQEQAAGVACFLHAYRSKAKTKRRLLQTACDEWQCVRCLSPKLDRYTLQ